MLFHSLYAPGSGVYVEQLSVRLKGELDMAAFAGAWQRVVERHPILRTAFLSEGLKEPLQVVQRKVQLPIERQDWRGLPAREQAERLQAALQSDAMRGFDLTRAPLMRLALYQVADDSHQFVWTHHHLLLDGWSIPLLLGEVFAFYGALRAGQDLRLPAARPFRDYIAWLKRQDLAQAEAFWRRSLGGFTAPTPLTVVRWTAGERDAEGELAVEDFGSQEIDLPETATAAVQALARRAGLTLNTLVQGAWALLLSRYSGEQDVVFGTTVSGRPPDLAGAETMIGLLINTLPVRVQVPPEAQALPWLKELQAQQAALRQYEYSPLAQVQSWSEVPRGLPLFESILVFENVPLGGASPEGALALELEGVQSLSHTNYPLTVVVVPDRELNIKIAYNRRLFTAETVQRMLGHLATGLQALTAAPDATIARLQILTAAERRQLLGWGEARAHYPETGCIHELVETQARHTPHAVAVTYEDQHLTYHELNCRANRLAHTLMGLGVGPETFVGLYLERSLEMVIGILGILKAGGAYVPIDPSYPAERLNFILDDSNAPVLLTQRSLLDADPRRAHFAGRVTICLDDGQVQEAGESHTRPVIGTNGEPDSQREANPESRAKPEHAAYVIYTSGSTGKPKGVVITHRNVTRLFQATDAWYNFGPQDVWTLFHSCAFDFSVWELWGALFYGGRVVVVPYLVSRSPEAFYELLCREGVTVLNQTPSAFHQLIRADETLGICPELALRYVIFGGETLELQSLKPWFDRHGDERPQLVNMYGITETTVHVTYRPIRAADLEDAPGSMIGCAIPDLQVYILDGNRQPTPIAVPGELYVGGAGVARGYLNRPELTQERFIELGIQELGIREDPEAPNSQFLISNSSLVYRSGDLARFLPDGDIEYLGRIDFQVKIRGFRVELGEIESLLNQFPGIRESLVLLRDEEGRQRLVAYLVAGGVEANEVEQEAGGIDLGDLRRHLETRLPDYMVPAAYVLLDKFPLTPHGKVDRRALAALPLAELSRPALEAAYAAPRSTEELKLAEIWAQLLKVERVGIHDNFFELGGDSILSIQVIGRARQAGLSLTPRQLFQYPTIAELSVVIGQAREAAAEQGLVTGPLTLTPIQRWFFEHHARAPQHFNNSMFLQVWPGIDIPALEATLLALLAHHDALRLQFRQGVDGWEASIAGMPEALPFQVVDLSGVPPEILPARIEATAAEVQRSFDLSAGPLIRLVLIQTGPASPARLLIVVHHLAFDGVSWRIFLEDFATAFLQCMRGEPVALPPKTTSYRQWAQRLVEWVKTPAARQELAYWGRLAGLVLPPLPVDHPEGVNTYGSARELTLSLEAGDTQRLLQEVPAALGAGINAALLAALARAFERWTGAPRLLIEMEGHGREEVLEGVDLSRTVGWFTSIFPVLVDLEDAGSPAEAVRAVQRQLEALPNRGFGYGALRYSGQAGVEFDALRRLPVPWVNFNYLGQFNPLPAEAPLPLSLAGESPGPEQDPDSPRSADLYVVAIVTAGELDVRWLYSPERYEPETVEGLARAYLEELRALAGASKPGDRSG